MWSLWNYSISICFLNGDDMKLTVNIKTKDLKDYDEDNFTQEEIEIRERLIEQVNQQKNEE